MPISEKIIDEINKLNDGNKYKRLIIELLETEDKGSHKNNLLFEQIVNDYLNDESDGDEIK